MSDDAPEPTPAGPLSGSKSSGSKSFDPELETPEYAATTKDVTDAADELAVHYGKAVRACRPFAPTLARSLTCPAPAVVPAAEQDGRDAETLGLQ